MRPAALLAAFVSITALGSVGQAAATGLKADYLITLEGVTIGHAGLDGSFEDGRYDLKVNGQLTGLAGALSGGASGGATARGTVSGTRLVSAGFSAATQSALASRTLQLGLSGGNVTAVAIEPPFEERPNRVPLTDGNKRGVIDPLSGMLAVAENRARPAEAANCNRLVPVFDGTQRFNIVVSYADTRVVRRPAYTGNVLVCGIRYVPIAGHRTDRESVKFMAENRDISVWLAPVEGTRVLVPLRISIKTMLGTSVVEAQSWTVR